ncbi:MAG: hypothetical protein ACPL7M_07860 [Bryobacteraceae bacterium]
MSHFNLSMPVEFRLRPWVRAETLEWPDLFWTPVSGLPVRAVERQWEAEFLRTLVDHVAADSLSPCWFLEAGILQGPLQDAFLSEAATLAPLPGYCRRLWDPPPGALDPAELDAIRQGRRSFSYELFARGLAFWVDPPDSGAFCLRYGGYGGLTVLFAAPASQPDPLAAFPAAIFENPFLKQIAPGRDLRREFRQTQRVGDPRMATIQKEFLRGWEGLPHCEKALFVVPKLKSLDFFSNERPALELLLQVAPVCFFESAQDDGFLLVSAAPFSTRLAGIMAEVRARLDAKIREEHR